MPVAAGRAGELDEALPLAALLGALRGSDPPVIDGTGLAALAKLEGSRFLLGFHPVLPMAPPRDSLVFPAPF